MKRDVTEIPPIPGQHRVAYGGDPNQFFDVWTAANPKATVAFIHGGFWRAKYDLTHASHFCHALAARGYNVANIEYRRVGNPGGGWDGTMRDIEAAVAAAHREFGQGKLIICGHSAGGHLALLLASRNDRLAGTVALAPVAVLRTAYELHLSNDAVVEFMSGTPAEKPTEYESACPSKHQMLSRVTIVHGIDDDVAPLRLSHEFAETRYTDGIKLLELPNTGHMELIDPQDSAFETICAEIANLLS